MILTGHTKVIGVADKQRIAHALVGLAITTGSDTAEIVLAFFFAPARDANVGRGARARARAQVRPARPSGERISDGTF